MRFGICIPWDSPFIWTQPAISIMNLDVPDGCTKRYFNGKGWCAAQRHNCAVNDALDWGADYIFFAGGDEIFEPFTIPRLYEHIDKYDMVSGMIPSRGVVEGRAFAGMGFIWDGGNWKVVTEKDEPQKIHTIGTGILLCRADVFSVMPRPYFTEEVDKSSDSWARTGPCDTRTIGTLTLGYGKTLFLDTTVHAKHIDAFHIDWSFQERFADKPDNWVPAKG